MSIILRLHYGHHGSACIVKDGKLIAALSLERLTRIKVCHGVNDELIDYLLAGAGISIDDVDHIAISDWNPKYAHHPISLSSGGKQVDCLWNLIYGNTCLELKAELRGKTFPAFHIGHQLGHAAAAFYTSPFDEAYCFTMDASGAKHKNNSLVSYGKGNKLNSLYCPGLMVGVAYGFFTEYMGIGPQILKAGSTMALAGYGHVFQRVKDKLPSYVNECFFPDDKDYHKWYTNLWKILSNSDIHFSSKDSDSEHAQSIAATIQHIFENAILNCCKQIDSKDVKNLCLGGGSMLNCKANSLVLRESQFENVHLFPGCTDEGCCVGTALYVAHHILGEPRHKYTDAEICFLGPDKSSEEPDYFHLAGQIDGGRVIAWCNGRGEFGPRALGNRSILADPRRIKSRERINFEIKNREWYRPLAPVILEEHASEWFDFPTKSPFMLFTAPINYSEEIPAAKHVDNTARVQTVNENYNPHFYRLIKAFYELTGVPLLINTSLNVSGEPMVETDAHALEFFNRGLVDILVLNGKVYEL